MFNKQEEVQYSAIEETSVDRSRIRQAASIWRSDAIRLRRLRTKYST
jgi:hypothetical protein